MVDWKDAESFNAAVFVLNNKIVNENGNPIEFNRHRFLAQPYMDNSPRQVIRKCGQVGWSVLAIIRSIHLAKFLRANVIYTLPSKSVVKDFVTPKVDPLINSNPRIKEMVGRTDSTALKSIGDRFIYFRGSWEESSAISISAHILINDEVDRSNQKVLETYRTRLDAAKMERPDLGWIWQFSNPSMPGYGVDEDWEKSDQKHWMVKCSHCNEWQYLDFPNNIDFDKKIYICRKCKRELSDEVRIRGRWVPKYFGREISGYWLSQLMAPWHSASKIIEDSKGDLGVFHNFTLGKPYQVKDQSVSRGEILKNVMPGSNPRSNVAIGVDNGIVKTYVVGNKYGIFQVGETESWEEIEELRNRYGAYMVIDANPYPAMPKKLVEKYRGKVFMHYYVQDKKQVGTIRWGDGDRRGIVESDRTKIIDAVVADFVNGDMPFTMAPQELENSGYIHHWQQMFRVVEETERGIMSPMWKHPEGKPDHFAHATVYWKVAMQKTLSDSAVIVAASAPKQEVKSIYVDENKQTQGLDLTGVVRRAAQGRKGRDWTTR